MIRSIDTLQKNFTILQKKQENTSANFANLNSYGYKSQQLITKADPQKNMFNHLKGANLNQKNDIGAFTFGNRIDEISKDMSSGSLKQTSKATDYAVLGEGYFNIQLPNGTIGYTKNGHFSVNQQNQLVTQEGYQVLSNNGEPINIRDNQATFRLTRFANGNDLVADGESLFTATNAGIIDNQSRVEQKMLEGSNVNMVNEMTNLMTTAREFEINQKALHTSDETLRKAVNDIGRV